MSQYRTIPDLVSRRVRETPDRIAFCALGTNDEWQPVAWRAYADHISRLAHALRDIGAERTRRAAILAPTSIDWEYAQMACLFLGMSVVGIDPNYSTAQRDDVLRSVEIDTLFVQDESVADSIPSGVAGRLKHVVTFREGPAKSSCGALSLRSLLANVASTDSSAPLCFAEPDDEAFVVFSSGTTGRPKPIPYSHRQVVTAVTSILNTYPDMGDGDHLICWLPLANLFQRIVNLCGVECGAMSYVISDPREIMRYVPRANPHVLIGVPRFYEKLHAAIGERIRASPRIVSVLTNWALRTAAKRSRAEQNGLHPQSLFDRGAVNIAEWLVLRRLRRSFGTNLKYFISGSAPMPLWLLEWFDGIGLPVYEAYGVSENIVPIAMNRPEEHRAGTVGRPLAGQEVRIGDDKEILIRGPGVFHGYLAKDGEASIGPDALGFWATGDYGEFDTDGFLRVLGRKSEMFKLSTGRWIAPTEIEALLRQLPYVEHALVVGAGQRFLIALMSIDLEQVATPNDENVASSATALLTSDVAGIIRRDVERVTAVLPPYQRPTGILGTRQRFTIENGDLTANLKLRRSGIETKFGAHLQALIAALEQRAEKSRNRASDDNLPLLVHWL